MTETDLLAKVTHARKRLLLDYPWFGTLALMLKVELSDKPKHAAHTDGTFIRFRPDYVEAASDTEMVTLWAHETLHCALQHPYRCGNREAGEFNVAADYAVNPILKKAGMELPQGWLYDPHYDDMSAEQIYAARGQKKREEQGNPPQQQPQQQLQQQPQAGGNDPQESNQPGEFGPPTESQQGDRDGEGDGQAQDGNGQPDPNQQGQPGQGQQQSGPAPQMTAEDWKIAAEQASRITQKAGTDPGAAGRAAKATHDPDTDWRGELQEFMEHLVPSDYTWSNPNRRHIANGLYLPGVHKENLGTIVFAVDCSGSISERLLNIAASHSKRILQDLRPERIVVVYWDTKVQGVEEFTPDDFDLEFRMHGGGGTLPQCLFDYLAKQDEPPVCLVNFTDLMFGQQPTEPADYQTLWLTGVQVKRTAPFGRTVRIDEWE